MDTATRFEWRSIRCSGTGDEVSLRVGCSATLVGHCIWVIGGVGYERRVSVLDTEARSWKDVDAQLGERDFNPCHAAGLFEDKILIFGVRSLRPAARDSYQVFAFDVVTTELVFIPTFNSKDKPIAQFNLTVELYAPTSTMAFIGGTMQDTRDARPAKLHLLKMDTLTWSAPRTKGRGPASGPGPSLQSCLIGSKMFTYSAVGLDGTEGAINFIDLAAKNKYVWSELKGCRGQIKRYAPSLSYVGKGRLLLYGGFSGHLNPTTSFTIIDIADSETQSLDEAQSTANTLLKCHGEGEAPKPRPFPQTVLMHDKLVSLGGHLHDGSRVYFMFPTA